MKPDTMAIKEDSHSSISPATKVICDLTIDASTDVDIASICVAVLHFDRNNVRKLLPENSVASRTPDMIISLHKIMAAGMIADFEII